MHVARFRDWEGPSPGIRPRWMNAKTGTQCSGRPPLPSKYTLFQYVQAAHGHENTGHPAVIQPGYPEVT